MAGKLKPLDVDRMTTPGKYPDGGGLYLIVAGPNSRNWSYRYQFNTKERWHGLGSFPTVKLADARLARDAARLRVKGDRKTPGVDIIQEKREAREEKKTAEGAEKAKTFEECAQAYIDEHWNGWKDFRNPAELTKQLREKLPKRPKRVIRHHPALPYADADALR